MSDMYELNKLTNCHWANLYEVRFRHKTEQEKSWIMCSRKERPVRDASRADAVVVVPRIETEAGTRLVVTKEFRVPVWDFEYGFPSGLIDEGETVEQAVSRELKEETGLQLIKINHISTPVYSSAGLTDESCHMVLAEAGGEASDEWLEASEDIEVLFMDVADIRDLLASDKKVAAKAWGLLRHYAAIGRID